MDRLFVRSLSFDNLSTLDTLESPPALLDALTSKRVIVRGSLSFEKREGDSFQVETTVSMVSPKPAKKGCNYKPIILPRYGSLENLPLDSPVIGMVSPEHQAAALRVQKVYKSFRTRRQLADCAVLVEQRWFVLCHVFNLALPYLIQCVFRHWGNSNLQTVMLNPGGNYLISHCSSAIQCRSLRWRSRSRPFQGGLVPE